MCSQDCGKEGLMMKVTISLLQLAFEFGAPEKNFEKVTPLVAEAARRGSDIILLPELWASGYDLANWRNYASPLGEGDFAKMADLAVAYQCMIGGSLLELGDAKAYNTFVLYDRDGKLIQKYRKIHLFRLLEEEKYLASGGKLSVAELPWGKTGLSICYDLRFPEPYRQYAMNGVRLVLLVAEWPERRIKHWHTLLKARAIENQIFIAAVNKVGESMGARLGGRSMIVDPWGRELVYADTGETILTASINLEDVDKARKWIPVLKDRQENAYKELDIR